MPIDFYYHPASPACRLVRLVAAVLDLELSPKDLNLLEGEHLKPEFLKLNPQHKIPTIVDDGFALGESRAISRYLLAKYGKNSSLYPEDLETRAKIDQILDFELGTLYAGYANYAHPMFEGAPPDPAKLKKIEDGLQILNTMLEGQHYAVGSELTLADLALVATVSTLDAMAVSFEKFPNVTKWYELIKTTAPKYEEMNGKGVEMLRGIWAQRLNAAK
ncbi:hypothetical protein ABMA28_001791 [Loxostege sticticalis]|uniref:Glutathione S-transferase n=1 Tax=Loxostege sticticalis TaxID=481309 RepID=A0ABD0T2W8_LOXSC